MRQKARRSGPLIIWSTESHTALAAHQATSNERGESTVSWSNMPPPHSASLRMEST
jgi:hypothetical protein